MLPLSSTSRGEEFVLLEVFRFLRFREPFAQSLFGR